MISAVDIVESDNEKATTIQACDFPALWASRVNAGSVSNIVELYNENGVLMPTFSPHSIRTKEGLTDYFTQLASREGLQVTLHANSVNCLKIENQSYVLNGLYSFVFEVDGTLLNFPCRFTFVIDLSKEKPILHHQSSQVPRTLN